MPLVDSLLTAVVRSDGDALVLHVGEKPYVVAASGPVELSRQGLGLGAMEGMLAQLLNADALRVLREMGAVEHELEQRPASAGDRFTVVAARGGDDIWIELRRHRRLAEPARPLAAPTPDTVADVAPAEVPAPMAASTAGATESSPMPATEVQAPQPSASTSPDGAPEVLPDLSTADVRIPAIEAPMFVEGRVSEVASVSAVEPTPVEGLDAPRVGQVEIEGAPHGSSSTPDDLDLDVPPAFAPPAAVTGVAPPEEPRAMETLPLAPPLGLEVDQAPIGVVVPEAASLSISLDELESDPFFAPQPVMIAPLPVAIEATESASPAPPPAVEDVPTPTPAVDVPPTPMVASEAAAPRAAVIADAPVVAATPVPPAAVPVPPPVEPPALPVASALIPAPVREWTEAAPPAASVPPVATAVTVPVDDPLPGVVLALNRDALRNNGSTTRGPVRLGGIERLLRVAAARGASALYLTTQARPAVRVDGDIRLLDGEPALSSGDVEAAVLELAPEGARDKESAEWIRDLDDVGRVRITTFRDYRGPGAILRMIQARPTSAEQLGLVREIQALASEPEGLVIVTGPRASGKSTLVSAFVDLINRQRNDHVITLEGQIRFVHESRGSLVSQREVRGSAAEVVAAARAALRENPDVLVVEDLRSPDVLQAALDAAGSGLLVFASVTAASATAALERLVDLCPSEQRRTVRAALAEHLRGVVAQVLLRKAGGGRLAARELVLNTNAVAALIGDGQIGQLPRAIDSGRKVGMAPLNDALVAFVQSGAVDVREAYRKADDKVGFLALLRREGIDTSFVERLA